MRMAVLVAVVVVTVIGLLYLADTQGWIDLAAWARVLDNAFQVREVEIKL